MMKRMRTVDVPPKFRRPLKNRTASRLGESVYFKFFSPNNLIYLKFVLMWLGCIALDFVIGFRFELLWPVWLLVRHLYESFRVHAFSSSLHYSAFSVFFVCVTATSDLVCYLFIPIQVLLFIASTYVWVQFVYQSTDRGICLPSLFLWTLFLAFEYSMRYRFDNATWYLTRSSWLTAGLFPSTADTVSVGSASGSSPPPSLSPRLELYRPFAAHCLGFPIVTLGFRVKSFFSKWRMRVRKEEVMRQNEFFERILASAVPSSFEDRRHFISSRHYLDLEQDAIDYELESSYNEENIGGSSAESRLYSQPSGNANSESSNPHLALCNLAAVNSTIMQQTIPRKTSQKIFSKTLPSGLRSQQAQHHNGQQISPVVSTANGLNSSSSGLHRRNGGTSIKSTTSNWAGNSLVCNNTGNYAPSVFARKAKQNITYSNRGKHLYTRLWGTFVLRILNILTTLFYSAILNVYKVCGCPVVNIINNFLQGLRGSDPRQLQQQDDLISSSGDGSHIADDESDQEEQLVYQYGCSANGTSSVIPSSLTVSKKKNRRTRGRTPLCAGGFISDVFNSSPVPSSYVEGQSKTSRTSSSSNLALFSTSNTNGHVENSTAPSIYSEVKLENTTDADSPQNLENENTESEDFSQKNCKEKELDKLKDDLKRARTTEQDLRSQLSNATQQERQTKNELTQSRSKLENLDIRYKQLSKQIENCKATINMQDKRIGEVQLRKNEVEQELANERLRMAATAMAAKPSREELLSKQNMMLSAGDVNQSNKAKILDKERIITSLKQELQTKEEQNQRLDREVKLLRNCANKQSEQEMYSKQIQVLEEKNSKLEQTLSSENRLKQDLFRALNDSKAQIQALNVRLRSHEQNGATNNFFNNPNPRPDEVSGLPQSSQHSFSSISAYSPSFCTGAAAAQNSQTPPPAFSSALSLDASINAIMQATGAQHMSYSFGQLEESNKHNQQARSDSGIEQQPSLPSDLLIIGSHRTMHNLVNNNTATTNSASAARTN